MWIGIEPKISYHRKFLNNLNKNNNSNFLYDINFTCVEGLSTLYDFFFIQEKLFEKLPILHQEELKIKNVKNNFSEFYSLCNWKM